MQVWESDSEKEKEKEKVTAVTEAVTEAEEEAVTAEPVDDTDEVQCQILFYVGSVCIHYRDCFNDWFPVNRNLCIRIYL